VPFDLIEAGTSASTEATPDDAVAEVEEALEPEDELELELELELDELLLPHPAMIAALSATARKYERPDLMLIGLLRVDD
jgi:hypothetical protein